jgi:hypothetical protein
MFVVGWMTVRLVAWPHRGHSCEEALEARVLRGRVSTELGRYGCSGANNEMRATSRIAKEALPTVGARSNREGSIFSIFHSHE